MERYITGMICTNGKPTNAGRLAHEQPLFRALPGLGIQHLHISTNLEGSGVTTLFYAQSRKA